MTESRAATNDSVQQNTQESQYEFPYHYIPNFDRNGFSQVKVLRWGYEYAAYVDFVLELIQRARPASVLDVGCGDGRLLYELHKRAPDISVTGVDRSSRAISFARAFAPAVNWVSSDLEDLVESSGGFDVVTLVEVIEHIPPEELHGFVETVSKALAENGKLIVTVPSNNIPVSKKHYQHFSRATLESALHDHFKIDEVYYLNRSTIAAKGVRHILSNPLFSVTSSKLASLVYRIYRNNLLVGDAANTRRICVVCSAKH